MGDADKILDIWISLLRHVIGHHIRHDGECDHEPLPDDHPTLDSDSAAMECLCTIVLHKKLLMDCHTISVLYILT